MKFRLFVLLLIPFICLNANNLKDSDSPAQLAEQYKQGVGSSAVKMLESSIDAASTIIVKNNIINKISNYSREEFINLVEKKVIGSWKDDSQASVLYEDANNAAVKLENVNGKLKYQSYITCLKDGEDWKIVNVIITINKI